MLANSRKGEPEVTALCHCIDCQKWSGGAFTSNVVTKRSNFKVTKGTPKTWDVTGDSGKNNKHFFCGSEWPFSGDQQTTSSDANIL